MKYVPGVISTANSVGQARLPDGRGATVGPADAGAAVGAAEAAVVAGAVVAPEALVGTGVGVEPPQAASTRAAVAMAGGQGSLHIRPSLGRRHS